MIRLNLTYRGRNERHGFQCPLLSKDYNLHYELHFFFDYDKFWGDSLVTAITSGQQLEIPFPPTTHILSSTCVLLFPIITYMTNLSSIIFYIHKYDY